MNKILIQALDLMHCPVTVKTTWSFIRVTLSDGMTGWGEASWIRHPAALDAHAGAARQHLVGQPWHELERYLARETNGVPQAAILSALEQALWDIKGHYAGCYAAGLGGRAYQHRIPLYANINRGIVERDAAGFGLAGQKAARAGFTRIKIAPFDGLTPENIHTLPGRKLLDHGLARVAATRQSIGTNAELFVDCHWRFDPLGAAAVLPELAALGVSWFECPLPENLDNIAHLKHLRGLANTLGMRLAGLEELTHPKAFLPWLSAGVYDVVMPDVKYARGIGGVRAIARTAAAYGIGCAPHNPSGPIAHAASLVACALDDGLALLEHQFDETPVFWRLVSDTFPRPADGASLTPTLPGLGAAARLE